MKKILILFCLLLISVPGYCATKNLVPRANNEGFVGTTAKKWAEGNFVILRGGSGGQLACLADGSNCPAAPYLPLAGGTMTGILLTDNLGIQFDPSDTNPTCLSGSFFIFADLSENKLKKCANGSVTDLDTTGGTPDFGTISGGTNTTAAMVVGSGASLTPSGTGSVVSTSGDSATGFFPAGLLERVRGGTNADTSGFNAGLFGSDGSNNTIDVDTEAELETALNGTEVFTSSIDDFTSAQLAGALSNESGTGVAAFTISPVFTTPNIGSAIGSISGNAGTATALAADGADCSSGSAPIGVSAAGASQSCTDYEEDLLNSAGLIGALNDETGTGLSVFNNTPTIATPNLTGKIDYNNVSVDDDDCTGDQGKSWYDSVDSQFEYCNANSGTPTVLGGGGGGSGDITSVGDVSSGAAFDGTQGRTLTFFNAGGNAIIDYDGNFFNFSKPAVFGGGNEALLTDSGGLDIGGTLGTNNQITHIDFETSPTTVTLTPVNGSTSWDFSGIALKESGNAVPNATDHLGFFAATTSAQLLGVLNNETGSASGTPLAVFNQSPVIATPSLTGKITFNGVAVDDDDCTGDQGKSWYDSVDSRYEFCEANSGTPAVLGSGAGGDDVSVNGTAATGANFKDGDILWALNTTPSPDEISGTINSGVITYDQTNHTGTLSSFGNGANAAFFSTNGIIYEGATNDNFETLVKPIDPTSDRTLDLPNVTGTLAVYQSFSGDVTVTNTGVATVASASTSAAGKSELATTAETSTGTDTTRTVTPDGLAGSIYGRKNIQFAVFDFTTDTATGDGKYYFYVPADLNGMNLVAVNAQVITAGTTNTLNVDLARCAVVATGNACSGTVADMLSTNLTIDSNEDDSGTAATAAVIDTSNDDVATGQIVRVDVDAVHTTAAKGLIINLTFETP